MAKNKKHSKHKGYNPPLTFVDKLIYFSFLIVSCFAVCKQINFDLYKNFLVNIL